MKKLSHFSLFSGIGGFDLASEWAGFEVVGQVEIDNYCNKILEKYWRSVYRWGDIESVTKESVKEAGIETITVISAGFPCPAFSRQGKGGGFEKDPLFFEAVRVCEELRPKYILFENVEGFTKYRETLHEKVENIGYEWSDYVLDARDFGIPQSRRRYFAICVQRGVLSSSQYLWWFQGKKCESIFGTQSYNPYTKRWWTPSIGSKGEWRSIFSNCRRSRNVDGVSKRMDRLRGLGNAVIPQQCYPFFKLIALLEGEDKQDE